MHFFAISFVISAKDVEQKQESLKYPRAVPFIVANEFCERFNYYGMRTVLVLYLTLKLQLSDDTATVLYHTFMFLNYFTCVFGAILADAKLGKFYTIFYLSIVYATGSVMIAIGAIEPLGMPMGWVFKVVHIPSFHHPFRVFTLIGLLLIAIGSGGIKPCVAAFGAEQFKLPEQAKQLASFFSVFYFSINAGSLISTVLTPILREEVKCCGMDDCFPLAFGVPALLMVISLLVFLCGKCIYKVVPNPENMMVKVSKCIAVSFDTIKFK